MKKYLILLFTILTMFALSMNVYAVDEGLDEQAAGDVLMEITCDATGYEGIYDSNPHTISVNVTNPSSGATITYGTSEDDITLPEAPAYIEVGTHTVWYKVTADGYEDYTGSADIIISDPNDLDNDGYNDNDVATIQNIIKNSPTLSAMYDLNNPASWAEGDPSLVVWGHDPQRVTSVNLEGVQARDLSGELDVSGLTELVTLICCDNTGITSISLPANSAVFQYLNCVNTSITTLDVSSYPKLEILYCSGTDLTALDVSANPMLKELGCADTELSSLDVSKNHGLTGLECWGTNISEFDLSANLALERVIFGDSASKLITADGYSVVVNQTPGGRAYLMDYDAQTKQINLNAQADEGYEFVQWKGLPETVDSTSSGCKIVLTDDLTVSAEFILIPETSETVPGNESGNESETKDPEKETDTSVKDETDDKKEETTAVNKGEGPSTGDNSPVKMLAFLMLVSATICQLSLGLIVSRKRK